jgi:hypothetical protein
VTGPLLGSHCQQLRGDSHRFCTTFHVYYARYAGREYAAATFWNDATGADVQSEQFRRSPGGRWRDTGDGFPAECGFPAAVVKAWAWRPCRSR